MLEQPFPFSLWWDIRLSLEINSGAESHLQPREDLMPEQRTAPKESHDSEGSWYWSSLPLGGLQPAEDTHAGRISLGRTVSFGRDIML